MEKIVKDKTITFLKEGDMAPDFSGVDQDGKKISLKDFKGKKLILYFYPKDDTLGCTEEARNLRDNYEQLKKLGLDIVGVSADDKKSHKDFIAKNELPFRLIADTNKEIIKSYGVWGEKTVLGKTIIGILRTTFIISETGRIEKVLSKVDTNKHTEQILSALNLFELED